ncbi:MAG: 4-oxalocrotonate tautomerase family protein [Catenulispora sp.]
MLYAALVDGCVAAGIDKDAVSITLREPGLDDWGIRGGIPASDVFAPSPGRSGP